MTVLATWPQTVIDVAAFASPGYGPAWPFPGPTGDPAGPVAMTFDQGTVAPDVGTALPAGAIRGDSSSVVWWADAGVNDAFFASLVTGIRIRVDTGGANEWREMVLDADATSTGVFWTLPVNGPGATEGSSWWTVSGGAAVTVSKV